RVSLELAREERERGRRAHRSARRALREERVGVDTQEPEEARLQELIRVPEVEALPDELQLLHEQLDAEADRFAAEVRFREADQEVLLAVARRDVEGQRLAVTEQVVGRVADAEEAAGITRDAAVQLDLLASLL